MHILGKHLLIEYYGCDPEILNSREKVRDILLEGARRSGATIVADLFHTFSPHGVSGVVVIAESHVAIHTWPEHCCAAVDVFSCSSTMDPLVIQKYLQEQFKSDRVSRMDVERGIVFSAATAQSPETCR